MKRKAKIVKTTCLLALYGAILGGASYGNYECYIHANEITNQLCGSGVVVDNEGAQDALLKGDEQVQKIANEGIVLLKNENNVLPLKATENEKKKINLFGVGSTDDGFSYTGVGGSGVATILPEDILDDNGKVLFKKNRVTLQEGLESENFEINKELLNHYVSGNPSKDFYKKDEVILKNAINFSDTAVITISRITGENYSTSELVPDTKENKGKGLKVSPDEMAMIDFCKANFEKVIVLINSTNSMELGFLEDSMIDAALNVGVPGQSGTKSIGKILNGSVNPSGNLATTLVYDTTLDPTYQNVTRYGGGNGKNQITYAEDIYLGYKRYETADEEGYFDDIKNSYGKGYDAVVQYPFGYGLSYTKFEYKLNGKVSLTVDGEEVNDDDLTIDNKKTTITIPLTVKNIGKVPGKETIQCYYSAPYYDSEIEKSSVNLVAFEKTGIIEPNQSEDITLTFEAYDMASYDCYDKNKNGISGWELDPGEYKIQIKTNAHEKSNLEDIVLNVPESQTDSGRKGLVYRFDPHNKGYVKNRFTGENAEAQTPIDGSGINDKDITYLSRSDFKKTFPVHEPMRNPEILNKTSHKYVYRGYDEREDLEMPLLNRKDGEQLYLYTKENGEKASQKDLAGTGQKIIPNEELIMELGENYNSPKWDQMLSQMSTNDIERLVAAAGFGTKELESIGKPLLLDYDGPSGFNHKMGSLYVNNAWTGFAGECVLAQTWNVDLAYQMGRILGDEAKVTGGITGWYAPCVNLHRTPYNTRNYEAYSEDGVISGYFGANVIKGALTNGLTCYLKHFALSEAGWNPNDVDTWLTEQNLRENYLKPFEIAVKKGGANAVMSAFNRVGGVRCVNSYALLTDVLRKEWGFKGSIVTDYNMGVIEEHVRAGNDLHLTPNESAASWLDKNDVAEVYAGYKAVKNSVYTYCNTYYKTKTYDPNANLGTVVREEVFPWWIPLLISVDVLLVLGIGFLITIEFYPISKMKEHINKNKKSESVANS